MKAVFLHANGFPPAAYQLFLNGLSATLDVHCPKTRPVRGGLVDRSTRWSDLARDALETQHAPFLAIGHSMGATAWIDVVAEQPERFTGLVLIEPAMVRRWQALAFRTLPYAVRQRIGPAASARSKRDTWPDRDAFLSSCMRSGLYERLSAESLQCFADAALRPCADGVTLVFSKDWEAHFYTNPPWPAAALARTRVPLIGIRAAPSIFLDEARWSDLRQARPDGSFHTLDGGHLVPLEAPETVAACVLQNLR